MTSPLALLLYERLLPGSALINGLRDLGYRVHHVADAAELVTAAETEKPLVVFADLELKKADACAALQSIKANAATAHLPIIAFSSPRHFQLQEAALAAGATLIASDEAVLAQLEQMLDQAMTVE